MNISREEPKKKNKVVETPNGVLLEPGERSVLMVRQHWYVFRNAALLCFFVPFVLLWCLFMLDYVSLPDLLVRIARQLFLYASLACFVSGIAIFAWRYFIWKNTFYLVTNKRLVLVNQLSLFSHDDRETGLSMIQDVRSQVNGIQAALYGFGDVIVQVSSQDSRLVLEKVGKPRDVQHAIVREAHLKAPKSTQSQVLAKEDETDRIISVD